MNGTILFSFHLLGAFLIFISGSIIINNTILNPVSKLILIINLFCISLLVGLYIYILLFTYI
jgi:hypothetical protein